MKYIKIRNPWKTAFFIFLGMIAVVILSLVIKVKSIPEIRTGLATKENLETTVWEPEEASFEIHMTKRQANKLIQPYLEKFQEDSLVKYEFIIADEAILRGNFEVFGFEVAYTIYLEPRVLENGDVDLFARDIFLGSMSLPVPEVLKIVGETVEFPAWVGIDSENQTFVLHLEQLTLENGMRFKLKEINLQEDSIQADVFLSELL